MLIKKLELVGKNVETAAIEFTKNCTVISGASNTGKSFVFECLKFMFGDSDSPKEIVQAKPYTRVILHIKVNKKEIKLTRSISGQDYEIEENGEVETKSRKEVNGLFLQWIGLGQRKLKKNESNETTALSFSSLRNFFFVDEVSIMSATSPILSGSPMSSTTEKSAFRLLIAGKDDSDLIAVDPPKIRVAKNRGKTEAVESIVKVLKGRLSGQSTKEIDGQLEKCNTRISVLTEQLREVGARSTELLLKKQNLYEKIDKINSQGLEVTETIKRFNLLNVTYQKDFARLEFIGETNFLLNQLPPGDCPYCERLMDHTHDENGELRVFDEKVMSALTAEGEKVRSLQQDLLKTLNELNQEREALIENRNDLGKAIKLVDREIESELSAVGSSLKTGLQEAMEERDSLMELKFAADYIEEAEQIGSDLIVTPEKKEKVTDKFGEDDSLFGLENEIQKVLSDWLDDKSVKVKFEKEDYDIVINGEPRKTFGKGFRSIYRTAFHIGLANYCIKHDLPHAGFIVVDSPLTTHSEADDKIDEGIEASIFEYFASYKDAQLIVLDNKEPKSEIRKKVNYVHFSGVAGDSNQGFIPIKAGSKRK